MKRFRHPIRAIREPFGAAGLIVACVALIAAVGGTAYAATKLNSTQKKEVEKIAKKVAKPGAPGAPGAAGVNGAPGVKGDAGSPGSAGTNGKSVVLSTLTAGQEGCSAGGTKVEVEGTPASKKAVCNGLTGYTETLPSGKTETGNWSAVGFFAIEAYAPYAEISYSIPLAQPSENVKYLNEAETKASVGSGGCELDVSNPAAKPVAPKGTLCVFARFSEFGTVPLIGTGTVNVGVPEKGDTTSGAVIFFNPTTFDEENGIAAVENWGTWAVTAK